MQVWLEASRDGEVFRPRLEGLPVDGILGMPGLYTVLGSNCTQTMKGEMVLVRRDRNCTKAYAFAVSTSTTTTEAVALHFEGPYKNFPAHHIAKGEPVRPEDVFGHTPASKKKAEG
jgi:hypothetical protein